MIEIEASHRGLLAPFFAENKDTLILSCLQGHMGQAFVNHADHPTSVQLCVADFCYFGGIATLELAGHLPGTKRNPAPLVIDPPQDWANLLETIHAGRFSRFPRYAMKKDTNSFDRETLKRYQSALPTGFDVKQLDETLCEQAMAQDWSKDFCGNFDSISDFVRRGIGFAVVKEGELVAAASSYTIYSGSIEIEIGTKEAYRMQGLATACGAALVLYCLENGIYPSWDAANLTSVKLAKKLGYHFDREYTTYYIQAFSDN